MTYEDFRAYRVVRLNHIFMHVLRGQIDDKEIPLTSPQLMQLPQLVPSVADLVNDLSVDQTG